MKSLIFSKKRLPVLLHILAWTTIIIIPQYLMKIYGGDNHFLTQFYTNTAILGLLFYLNYLWLAPRFFFRENKIWYLLATAGVLVVLSLLFWYLNEIAFFDPEREMQFQQIMKELNKADENFKPPIKQFKNYNHLFTAILVIGFSLGLAVIEKLTQNERERKELEKEKLNSELAFLKSQISPHFFFNTLNNIYSLIGINQTEAQDSVHKLSKLMRYLIYESEHTVVELNDEISFMKNYIELMQLRLSNKVKLEFSFPDQTNNIKISPLLFIPFIENAFKHGISYRMPAQISIEMLIEKTTIHFITKNNIYSTDNTEEKEKHSGIGLENVKKRLALLYPNSHQLLITENNNEFSVDLKLNTIT